MSLTEELPFQILRRTWQPVACSRELPVDAVVSYTLLNVELVLTRFADKRILAADVACPHKGANLARGRICNGELMCAYHGWRFDKSGLCKTIPSLEDPSPTKLALANLRTYAVQERYGFVWVKLEDALLPDGTRHRLPEVPEFEDSAWTYLIAPPTKFMAGWRREIENYVDMTHFAFAHAETLGKAADVRIPPMNITATEDGGFLMRAAFPALLTPHEQPGKLQSAHQRWQRGWLPNFTVIRQSFLDGDERVLVHIPSPNSLEQCTVFWSLAISPGFRGPPPESQLQFAIRVLDEDRQMCEMQIPREVPIHPGRGGWGVLVTPGDTLAIVFQKQLRKWLVPSQAEAD